MQAIGDAVADAVDRRRFLDRQGGLAVERIARSARKPAADGCCCRAGSCAALRAFLRTIRGPRRPFWQALHDDRGSAPIRRDREQATLARRRGATLGGASWGASMRFHPPPEEKRRGGRERKLPRIAPAFLTQKKFIFQRRPEGESLSKLGPPRGAHVRGCG